MTASSIRVPSGDSNPVNKVELSAAVIQAAAKIFEKESRRDDLRDGGAYSVDLYVTGRVNNGPVFKKCYHAEMSVGHATVQASSATPDQAKLIGHILSKLNATTREAILRDLPNEFAANGNELPAVAKEIEAATDGLLKKLRASKQVAKRGNVSIKHNEANPPLGLVSDEF